MEKKIWQGGSGASGEKKYEGGSDGKIKHGRGVRQKIKIWEGGGSMKFSIAPPARN